MSRTYESRANGLVLTAVILSGLARSGRQLHLFRHQHGAGTDYEGLGSVLVCGIGVGLFDALFSACALKVSQRVRRWAHTASLKRILIVAGICELASALIGLATGGATFGTGYEQARAAIEGEAAPSLYFLEKLASTFLAMMSGIPGGIFAPSLSVGAVFGSTVSSVLGTSIGLGAIHGMTGYFAGVVQAPMTAFVIILEMTGNHDGVIAFMAAFMLDYITSRMISSEPLYHGSARVFIAQGIRAKRASHPRGTEPNHRSAGRNNRSP